MQSEVDENNDYLEGEELAVTSYQISSELPKITSNQVEELTQPPGFWVLLG